MVSALVLIECEKGAINPTAQMLKIPGITRTETLIAFRVFSKHDLESMFSIGIDPA